MSLASLVPAGLECNAYYNTGSHNSPVWVEIDVARDVTINDEYGEGDSSIRGDGGFASVNTTLRKLGLTIEVAHYPTKTAWSALHGYYVARTAVEFLAMDGPTTSGSGAQGPRFWGKVTKFEPKQPLDGVALDDVVIKKTNGANIPDWYTQS